jgi:vacuolar-type H+-ATPase subunit I/STV1
MGKRGEFLHPYSRIHGDVCSIFQSKFYTIYPSWYVGYFCENVCAKLLCLAFYKKCSTMAFGLLYRKWAGPACVKAKAKTKKARKKAQGYHVKQGTIYEEVQVR